VAKRKREKVTINALVVAEVSVEYEGIGLEEGLSLAKDLAVQDFITAQGEIMDSKLTIVGVHNYEPANEALYR
jgi:hypothetical protein